MTRVLVRRKGLTAKDTTGTKREPPGQDDSFCKPSLAWSCSADESAMNPPQLRNKGWWAPCEHGASYQRNSPLEQEWVVNQKDQVTERACEPRRATNG
jgi:hypothetical protein